MCLLFNKEATDKLFQDNQEYITAYKIVEVRNHSIYSPVMYGYEYRAGWNEARFEQGEYYGYYSLTYRQNEPITFGIHVFLWHNDALNSDIYYGHIDNVIVTAKCYKEDLIGCDIYGRAVFRKVFIEELDHTKAFDDSAERKLELERKIERERFERSYESI